MRSIPQSYVPSELVWGHWEGQFLVFPIPIVISLVSHVTTLSVAGILFTLYGLLEAHISGGESWEWIRNLINKFYHCQKCNECLFDFSISISFEESFANLKLLWCCLKSGRGDGRWVRDRGRVKRKDEITSHSNGMEINSLCFFA